jgi:hypothetical protein
MLVTNRSNDIVWGAYGANAVHFSYLLEYVASSIGVKVGRYWQVSNDFHIYERHWPLIGSKPTFGEDMYLVDSKLAHIPLLGTFSPRRFSTDLLNWIERPTITPDTDVPFIRGVLYPVYMAWENRKTDPGACSWWLEQCVDSAWTLACQRWIARRAK